MMFLILGGSVNCSPSPSPVPLCSEVGLGRFGVGKVPARVWVPWGAAALRTPAGKPGGWECLCPTAGRAPSPLVLCGGCPGSSGSSRDGEALGGMLVASQAQS